MGLRPVRLGCRLLASVGAISAVVLLPAAAWAQSDYPTPSTTPPSTDCVLDESGAEVCGTAATRLPATGTNIEAIAAIGAATTVGGLALVALGRRARANT